MGRYTYKPILLILPNLRTVGNLKSQRDPFIILVFPYGQIKSIERYLVFFGLELGYF